MFPFCSYKSIGLLQEVAVLQFLQQVIEDCDGAAPVSVLMATHKSYVSMTLYAVDGRKRSCFPGT